MDAHHATPDPMQQLDAALAAEFRRATSIGPWLRRFTRVLRDHGVAVPTGWVDHSDPEVAGVAAAPRA